MDFDAAAPVTLCVLLWARPGKGDALTAYEDAVLELLPDHGARLLSRVRRVAGADDDPAEVQVIWLPSEDALDTYLGDPRREAAADARDAAIQRTQILRVEAV